MYWLILLLLIQGCHAQDKKNEKDIEAIQKSAASSPDKTFNTGNVDFRLAAKTSTPGVVNIKSTFKSQAQQYGNGDNNFHDIPDALKDFFKNDPFFRQFEFQNPDSEQQDSQPIIGSASGVILTPDGYIITNNHVIKNADEINVTLFDGRSYPAKLIGTDPQTDLALLKIDEPRTRTIRRTCCCAGRRKCAALRSSCSPCWPCWPRSSGRAHSSSR